MAAVRWPSVLCVHLRLSRANLVMPGARRQLTLSPTGKSDNISPTNTLFNGGVTYSVLLSRPYKLKVKAPHTRCRALGAEVIPVYRQSARR